MHLPGDEAMNYELRFSITQTQWGPRLVGPDPNRTIYLSGNGRKSESLWSSRELDVSLDYRSGAIEIRVGVSSPAERRTRHPESNAA
jgi:hypothetical protein